MAEQYQPTGGTSAEISLSVEAGVRDGALVPGENLPPVRMLATRLGVSPATVAGAYRELRRRGIVETAGRNGTRVRGRPPLSGTRGALRLPVPPGVLDLSDGGPDPRLLPPLPRLDLGVPRAYEPSSVVPELAAPARQRLHDDGVPVPALTVTSGALDGIDRVFGAMLRPGDRVAVEDPGWANLLDLAAAQGLVVVPMPVDDAGPTPAGLSAALAAGARAAVVTSRAHNPTGAAVSPERAAQLRAVLARHPEALVIEDDHAAELAGVPLASLAGATARWVFVRSLSKPYGPDLRLAVLAGDEATMARVEGRMRSGAGWVSTILQRAVAALWADPATAALVARARERYDLVRTGLRDALAARGVPAVGSTGINVWVPVPDETVAVARLRDAGYAVSAGALYRMATPPALRITIATLDPDGVDPLADAVAAAARPSGCVGT